MSSVHVLHAIRMSLPALLLAAGLALTPFAALAQPDAHRQADHPAAAPASGAYAALTDEHLRHLFHELMGRIDHAQQTKLLAVASPAKLKLEEFAERAKQARAPRRAIVLSDVVDRVALESVRVAEMRVMDERSHYVDDLLVALAGVLTPAQRAKFLADIAATTH